MLRVGAVTFQWPSSQCSKCQDASKPNIKEEVARGLMGKENGLRGSEIVVSSLFIIDGQGTLGKTGSFSDLWFSWWET